VSALVESPSTPARLSKPPAADRFAAALRGFGVVGIVAMVVIYLGNMLFLPLSAILVLIWAKASHTPWRELGYVKPRNWIATVALGIVLGVAFKFIMKALVMPLLGAPPINAAYHFLVGNTAALPWMIYIMLAGAAFGEETVFRGWMFERLGKLFGQSTGAKTAIVLITSVWFALAHYANQGIPGVEQALIVGLIFGWLFALTGCIFVLIIAHAAFDLTALAMIYWDVETAVAHLIFE